MSPVLRDSSIFLLVVILASASFTTGCKRKPSTEATTAKEAGQGASQNPSAQQLSVDDLVAPVALYPDQLLAQVLAISVNPQEVLDLGNWLLQNQNLQGDAMTNAAKQAGFSPSGQYLALFPQVVDNMCQQMDWTRQLGEAFKGDQKAVMDAVQRKRAQAQQMGNLNSSPKMTVENKKAEDGQPYVAIQPADPKVVYVPQYNPVTIYNSPPPAAPVQTTTTTTKESGVSSGEAVAIGLLSFGVGMAIGSAINNNYYPYPAWGYHSVYVVNRPYYPAAYRPPVYPGYRPAYAYNAPANYRWNQYNRNVNATINNNYYNRFNNRNANTLAANTRQGYTNQNRSVNARPVQNQQNWKGQTSYQGARSTNTPGQKPGAPMANAIPRNEQYGQRNQVAANRPNAGGVNEAANRPNAGSLAASNMAANRAASTGNIGSVNRSSGSFSTQPRQPAQTNFNRGGDRGYSAPSPSTRSADSAVSSNGTSASSRLQNASTGGAFGGGGGSGRQEQMASSRGRASMGARGGRRP
jgi:hypothetical protein